MSCRRKAFGPQGFRVWAGGLGFGLQGWPREKIVAVFNRLNEARAGVIRKKGDSTQG